MKIKPITAVGYTFLVTLISSLITVLCYHIFVFNTFSLDSSQPSALRKIDSASCCQYTSSSVLMLCSGL
ncbi:hypothetical protein V7P28_23180, partial [Klebsiella michiganensis]